MSEKPEQINLLSMNIPPKDPELSFKVRRLIRLSGILNTDDAVLLAVSGGADSVVLLELFLALKNEYGLTLGVAHLDHGLRGEASKKDRRFVEHLAQTRKLPCFSDARDVSAYQKKNKLSLEEAAREVRYDFLFETADAHGYSKIATAHHADDNAELVLMNLMRGSGPQGLSGMDVTSQNGRLIRPLLDVQRSDIMDYIKEKKLAFREDGSNKDRTFLRNRVRLELMPLLESGYRQGIGRTLSRTARIIREDEDWMASMVNPAYDRAVRELDRTVARLDVAKLTGLHPALLRRVIRKAFFHVKGDLKGIGFVHVDDVIGLLTQKKGRASLDLPGRVRVLLEGGLLSFVRERENLRRVPPFQRREAACDFEYRVEKPEKGKRFEMVIPEAGQGFRFSCLSAKRVFGKKETGPDTVFLDMDRLAFPLTIRNVRPGDMFQPLGMTGRQRVTRFFSNGKVPVKQRERIPVLVSGQQIVWVCGHRIDDSVKILPATENALKIELFLA